MPVKVDAIVVRPSNGGKPIQAPASVWLAEIISLMTDDQRDILYRRVEGKMSGLILQPAPLNGGKMLLKKPFDLET